MKAIVLFHPYKKSFFSMSSYPLEGFVLFTQDTKTDKVKITVHLEGLPNGPHGFHIHERSMKDIKRCSDVESCCQQLGGHFSVEEKWSLDNLEGVKHGEHNGDLCFNIVSDEGIANKYFYSDKISLFPGQKESVIDRSLVIHRDEDDMGEGVYEDEEKTIESRITGNAGPRIACGEIKIINEY